MSTSLLPMTMPKVGVENGVYAGRWNNFDVHFSAHNLDETLHTRRYSPARDYPVTVTIGHQLATVSERSSPPGRPLVEVFAAEEASPVQTAADIDPVSGLTMAEAACHEALQESYRLFLNLPRQHPDEVRDFVDGLHRIQDLFAMRIARRCYPLGWSTYTEHEK